MRAEYLFALGHLCHVPPAAVDDLTVTDFANLTDSVDAYLAEMRKER